MRSKKTFVATLFCFLSSLLLHAQTPPIDVNGDGTLNILVIGTNNSIQDNFEEFSPDQIVTELQSILSADTAISLNVNVVAEDIYRMNTVATGIANQFTANRDYYCHSLTQYYFWPNDRDDRMDNLAGQLGTDWDYVVMSADPFMVAKMPGYYSLGVNKVAAKVNQGGAVPLLLMEWLADTASINHFEEFTYRAADGAITPLQVIPAGLAWNALPVSMKDTAAFHPTPNGSYVAAGSIYAHLYGRSASSSLYTYNDTIADLAESTVTIAAGQNHYTGSPTFISPYKSCEISDSSLVYNHGGTSTENGILTGLQWVVAQNQKTLQYGAVAPIHFNYGRSSMGSSHLYSIDSTLFDYSFGYPLQDDASTGFLTMQYGLDKRSNSADVETDIGTARQMINQSELPYARSVPLRTLISQMVEEIPGVDIYPLGDPWHLSNDVNKAIGSYMYTIVTSDCAIADNSAPLDSTQWRTWMSHKIGQRTAWNVMYLEEKSPCNVIAIDSIIGCNSYTWIDGNTYTTSNSSATQLLSTSHGCDSLVKLNLSMHFNSASTEVQTGCDAYTWIDGNTYTSSNNTAMHTLTSSAGCDSVITLNLVMNTSSAGTDAQTACNNYTWIDGNTYTASNSTATHILVNSAGCDSVMTLNLTINTVDLSVAQTGALLAANEVGAAYQWLNCPSMTEIDGATSQSYTATVNGDYAVVVSNNECSDTSSCFSVTGVGFIENEFGNEILLFPNPTSGDFSIDLGSSYQTVKITITDINGKVIQTETFNGRQLVNLGITGPAGVYLLLIESGDLSTAQEGKKALIRLVKE
jgi:hypothetical protein